ncbi:MAG: class I SAM-dependent methyltransferase [Acidobacteriota bacterium]
MTTRRAPRDPIGPGAGLRDLLAVYADTTPAFRLFLAHRWWHASLSEVERLVPREGVVLDLGCGHGIAANLFGLRAPGRRVVAIERNPDKAALARGRVANVEVIEHDVLDTALPEARTVTIVDVLHHLESREAQERILDAVGALLPPGGTLVLKEVTRSRPLRFRATLVLDRLAYPGERFHFRRHEEFVAMLEERGFAVEVVPLWRRVPYAHVALVGRKLAAARTREEPGGTPVSSAVTYEGSELPVFEYAVRWKAYVRAMLGHALTGDVLEVGAGIGAATRALCGPESTSWTCLEPDPVLAAQLRERIPTMDLPCACRVVEGDISAIPAGPAYDCVTYFDVLEHIEDDRAELRRALERLRPGGRLIVVAPAFPALYSAFDAAIGHHRRYTRATLEAAVPTGMRRLRLLYLDAVGSLTSLVNRWLLRDPTPSAAQIVFWDRALVPCSRLLDPLVGHRFGRSLVGVWLASQDR